jgi:peroxiredoxin
VEDELAALGFPVIAISPDRPAKLRQSLEAEGLGYRLYSDSALVAARAFGIVFQLDEEEVARYRGFGIDLEDASGRRHHQLPVPSVFLVDADGIIRWVYSNPDYKVRPDPAALLEAARRSTPADARDPAR